METRYPLEELEELCKKYVKYLELACEKELTKRKIVFQIYESTPGHPQFVVTDVENVKHLITLRDIERCDVGNEKSILFQKTARIAALWATIHYNNLHAMSTGENVKNILKNLATKEIESEQTKTEDDHPYTRVAVKGLNNHALRNLIKEPRDTGYGVNVKSQAETEGAKFLIQMDKLISKYRYKLVSDYAELQALFIENVLRLCEGFIYYINFKTVKESSEYLVNKIKIVSKLRDILNSDKAIDEKITQTMHEIRNEENRNKIIKHKNKLTEHLKTGISSTANLFQKKKTVLTTESKEFLSAMDREIKNFEECCKARFKSNLHTAKTNTIGLTP
jgi:hypothetical protein